MKRHDYEYICEQIFERVRELAEVKGRDYAGYEDVLANFKRHGQLLGLSPMVVWAVYAGKHWDAVMSYIREPGRETSEPVQGRIDDLVTYLTLLTAMVEESKVTTDPIKRSAVPELAEESAGLTLAPRENA